MPKIEARKITTELEKGILWPVYALVGTEALKTDEVLKRIRKSVGQGWSNVIQFDAAEVTVDTLIDEFQSLGLGASRKLIVLKDAESLKNSEELESLLGPSAADVSAVLVLIYKDLDQRKKWTKKLIEKAAVIPCEEVAEGEREAWVRYLVKKHGIDLTSDQILSLCQLDPFSLMIVERELEKIETLNLDRENFSDDAESLYSLESSDLWVQSLLDKNRKEALFQAQNMAENPDEALPALGLLAWNVRHMALLQAQGSGQSLKIPSFVADRLKRYSKKWSLKELEAFDERLHEIDFDLKQTPKLPIGLWTDLVVEFT